MILHRILTSNYFILLGGVGLAALAIWGSGDRMKCILCRVNEAAVPDRERMGRPIKRVCQKCHADRLRGDLQVIMKRRKEKENDR